MASARRAFRASRSRRSSKRRARSAVTRLAMRRSSAWARSAAATVAHLLCRASVGGSARPIAARHRAPTKTPNGRSRARGKAAAARPTPRPHAARGGARGHASTAPWPTRRTRLEPEKEGPGAPRARGKELLVHASPTQEARPVAAADRTPRRRVLHPTPWRRATAEGAARGHRVRIIAGRSTRVTGKRRLSSVAYDGGGSQDPTRRYHHGPPGQQLSSLPTAARVRHRPSGGRTKAPGLARGTGLTVGAAEELAAGAPPPLRRR